ncbi:MAG: translation initiation factor IF-2 [Ignavibacteria bacterium]|nr:translation initiation factor IF-2 [Ignavibacteria bacterium]
MSELKEKKLRIAAVASMINIPSEDIITFLKKKGYEVKTVNSVVSEEMMQDIGIHYKNAIENAKRHSQKVEELKSLMSMGKASREEDKLKAKGKSAEDESAVAEVTPETAELLEKSVDETVAVEVEDETLVEETVPVIVDSVPVVTEETHIAEPVPTSHPEPVIEEKHAAATPVIIETPAPVEPVQVKEVKPIVEAETIAAPEPEQPEVLEEPGIEEDEVVEEEKAPEQADMRRTKLKGLKIVGVLQGSKADPSQKRPGDRQPNRPDAPKPQAPAQQQQANKPKDEAEAKKKKKKSKTKKKVENITPEELLNIKKKAKPKRFEINQEEIDKNIRVTMEELDDSSSLSARAKLRKKKKRERMEEEERKEEIRKSEGNKISVTEFIAVNELANLMQVSVGEVISKCIGMGLMVSINQRLDIDTITLVADEFGFSVEVSKEYTAEVLEDKTDDDTELLPRSPVVTIMGHVDHGKTSLLDYIRRSNVVAGESGGITQHIGAYKVRLPNGSDIAFLDTPGHEAFTAMRARGAQVTDIVVLVVAADDSVMPQTIEAINHAKAAGVPIVVAINKIDRPESNPERIRQQLADKGVLVEDWGGKYQCVELSAKTGKNIDVLLEKILLEAEILELKANPHREARGVVVESELDKGRGIIATVLIQKGTLRVGDPFVAGIHFGRVRAMFDERQRKVDAASPSTPVSVVGFEGAPQAGDVFVVVKSEREARSIATKRQQLKREQDQKQVRHITLDEISRQISVGGVKELPIIVKGDVDGSVEALSDSFMKLSNEEVMVRVIHRGVGAISEGDVLLADASNAIIIGFHVRPNLNARRLAETQKVDIRIYNIIYNAISEVKAALEGLLSPIISEEVTATLEIRDTFKVPKIGTVAGCYVQEGKIIRNNKIRLIRDGIVVFEGELGSLKRFKDDVREVDAGYECGLSIHNYNDLKPGDIVEGYKIIETKKKLI